MKTPEAHLMHEAQSRIGQWLLREVTLLVPAPLTVAAHKCGGELPELDYPMSGDADLILLVPLTRESAVDVGAASVSPRGEDLEVAQVVWCTTGHEEEGEAPSRRPVATYRPDLYARAGLPVIGL